MKKIVDDSILDIVPFTYGFVYAKKEVDESGNARAAFYSYNAQSKKVEAVRRTGYLHTKFGENFEKIVESVKNFIFCDSVILQNGECIVLTSDSRMYVFDAEGKIDWEENLCYRESPVRGLSADDDCIWFVVPEKNSIVRFSTSAQKVYTRIGGNETTTFDDPVGGGSYAAPYYSYFNLTSAEMEQLGHVVSNYMYPTPTCYGTKYSYENYFGN